MRFLAALLQQDHADDEGGAVYDELQDDGNDLITRLIRRDGQEDLLRSAAGASVRPVGCSPVSRRGGARRIQRCLCPCQSYHQRYCQPLSQYFCRFF